MNSEKFLRVYNKFTVAHKSSDRTLKTSSIQMNYRCFLYLSAAFALARFLIEGLE